MGFLVSSTEPPLIQSLGTLSQVPERFGVDIMWMSKQVGGLVGIQRKEWQDLLSSVQDGRLGKEVAQMAQLKYASLVVEGKPHFTADGKLSHRYLRSTRAQYRSILRSVQNRGVFVEHSDDMADTVGYVEEVAAWLAKGNHTTLDRRPKPGPDKWGTRTNKAFGLHVLQSVQGVGPKQAEAIWNACGGVPLKLTVTPEELAAIPGIGPKKVEAIVKAFG